MGRGHRFLAVNWEGPLLLLANISPEAGSAQARAVNLALQQLLTE